VLVLIGIYELHVKMTVETRTEIHLPSKRIQRNSAYLFALLPFTGENNQSLQNESQQTHTHTHTHTYLLVFLEIAATFIVRYSDRDLKLTTRVHPVPKLSAAILQLPYMSPCRAKGQFYKLLYDIDTARFMVQVEWVSGGLELYWNQTNRN